jgi:hypothetical protein
MPAIASINSLLAPDISIIYSAINQVTPVAAAASTMP